MEVGEWHSPASYGTLSTALPTGANDGQKKNENGDDFPSMGSLPRVSFTALILLVGWQEGHPADENRCHLSRKVLFQKKWRKKCKAEPASEVHQESEVLMVKEHQWENW